MSRETPVFSAGSRCDGRNDRHRWLPAAGAGLGELLPGPAAETALGVVGPALLLLIGVWARTRQDGRAVGAALLPAPLTLQA
ncbi:hypothetical protein ABZ590_04040 [Streptomyces hirsutus]|uniref:hypothetical protein n=1 Tax=Streptomyces hirsutus TaxID=35620 RepID=UPI00340863AA